jgi:hypothetical protein
MTATTLKKVLHKAIDNTEDTILLEAVYAILNRNPAMYEYELSTEQLSVVEERRKLYKKGKLKSVSMSDIKKKALQRIKK